jgi:general L-amino acid transport system substrate-binding protein
MTRLTATFLAAFLMVLGAHNASAQTLKTVKERGNLICGVSQGILGFSTSNGQDEWTGFDVDFCRAMAAAIFNDPTKVKFVPLSTSERFQALRTGAVDVLSRNTTWTMSRETVLGLNFAAVTYYDGQGFMIRDDSKIESALELGGKKICAQKDTTTELNVADYFAANNMKYELITFPAASEALQAYDQSRCDVLTSDISQLHAERVKLADAAKHVILPDIISKEPLGPAVRQGDDQWLNIVKWTHFAMLNGEELGVSSQTIDRALKSEKPEVKRLVGVEGNFGPSTGLDKDWAARIIRLVGNYDEVFERNVGTRTKLGIPRGINNLWTQGGIQYGPPIR